MTGAGSRLSRRQAVGGMIAMTTVALAAPATRAAPLAVFAPRGSGAVAHDRFDALLRRYVKPDGAGYNRVDYRALKQEGAAELDRYLAMLAAVDPTALSRDEAHAYWTNLYNAKTLEVMVAHYPVPSIRQINLGGGGLFSSGPWSRRILRVNGTDLSLDDVEHRIVRALFADPMSHYGLNCASYSCPNLLEEAYAGATIDAALARNARAYVNHRRGVAVTDRRITASKIYSWYADDFGGERQLKTHWQAFAVPELAAQIAGAAIGSYVYDWSINDV
jgi:hypothetical protein